MPKPQDHDPPTDADRVQAYPALAALRLDPQDLIALARQGFLSPERRGERTYYKLRFRLGSRQVVRYVGSAAQAAQVQAELDQLQSKVLLVRQLKAEGKHACRLLREAKRKLAPMLAASGLRFHGHAIRRPRT